MNTDDERRVYELGYHMVPTLTEAELQENVDALRKAISELKGNFLSESEPALMELAYTMYINEGGKNTGYDTAFFGWIKFDLDPEQLSHLQKEVLAENKNIIRHLLIKTVAEDTRAQINLEELREVKSDEVITPAKKEEKSEEEDSKASNDDLDETIDKLLEE